MHEIGHAVGLWHEHQRDDRDLRVTVWIDNVITDKWHNFAKKGEGGIDVGPYDYDSIMHYAPRDFCVDWRYAVPVPGQVGFASPALASFEYTLHVVTHRTFTSTLQPLLPGELWHSLRTASGEWTRPERIPHEGVRATPALAGFDNALHMVVIRHNRWRASELWHSRWTASGKWTKPEPFPYQGNWTMPALAGFDNDLHMVMASPHNWRRPSQLWHSRWTTASGKWTQPEPIRYQTSGTTPAPTAMPCTWSAVKGICGTRGGPPRVIGQTSVASAAKEHFQGHQR